MAKLREHPADLAVLALGQGHFQNGRLASSGDRTDPLGPDLALGQPDPFRQFVEDIAPGISRDHHPIELFHAEFGMGQLVGQFAVIGQDHQAGGLFVEPSDRVDPLGDFGEQVDDLRFAGGIVVGRDIAFRLVHSEVNEPFLPDLLAVDGDRRAPRVDPRPEFFYHLAIHGDPALEDQLLTRSA